VRDELPVHHARPRRRAAGGRARVRALPRSRRRGGPRGRRARPPAARVHDQARRLGAAQRGRLAAGGRHLSDWHNRWHPALEPVAAIEPGVPFTVQTREGTEGVITAASTHDDLLRVDLSRVHQLSGPFLVEGAEPGDLLLVDFLAYEPASFGFSAVFPGFGVLADLFDEPYFVPWELGGGVARSRELPGVAVPDGTF